MFGQLVFLQLSAEFGGTKFGPFPGPEIRLGSDPAASDITLPEALGVLPQHVKILIQGDGSFIVAPTERTAAVHVFRGSGRPKHIATATALAAGDSFALVTAEGPRFIILSEQPKQDKSKPKKRDAKSMVPSKEGLWAEIKRIGFTQVFRTRLGNGAMRAWTMIKTGTIFTPRVIIGFLFLSTGWLAAIGAGIAAIGGMFALSSSNDQLSEVQGDLAECEAFEADDDIFTLSARVLGDPEWPSSLRDDDTFHEAFVSAVGNISAKRDDYRWVYTNSTSDYTRLKRQAESDRGLGPEIGKVFAYTAAVPGSIPIRDWYMWTDTVVGERGCGRGPSRMTYMQARNMDVPAMPNTLVSSASLAGMELSEKREGLLSVPGMTQDLRELYESQEDEIVDVPVGSAGAFTCSYLEGDDSRAEADDLIAALRGTIGPTARGVPGVDQNYWITSRLIRYYAAGTDVREDFEALSFDGNPPTLALDALPSDQQELVVKKAATLAARAATIPCIAALAEGSDAEQAADVIGDLPAPTACLLFMFRAGAL